MIDFSNLPAQDKLYYLDKEAGITIYCGDCREILPDLPQVDLVLTDPPYNAPDIGTEHKVYENQMMSLPADEYRIWCADWFSKASEKTSNILFTPGIRNIWNYPPAKWVLCWSKPGARSFNGTGGFNIWELILLYGKPGKFLEDVIRQVPINLTNGIEHQHPCPKPKPVWDWLVVQGSKTGDTILDPFLGSGTTAVCAKKLGRKCIGIEIEEKYCEIAKQRLAQSAMRLETETKPEATTMPFEYW